MIPFLRSRGVDRLDTVMITSGTKSTLGGFDTITRLVPFRRVAESGLPTRSPDDIRWRAQTRAADWETMTVRAGDSWTTTGGLVVRILHPPRDWQRPRSADNALVFALEQHGHRILFLPAAGETVEQELLAHSASLLPAEVLVCGGHRQEPWATEALLDVVNPRVMVVAGPGAARPFGVRDPADPGLAERLRQRGITVLRTAKSGAVRILLDDRGYSVEPWR